jgi:hypothetical protein
VATGMKAQCFISTMLVLHDRGASGFVTARQHGATVPAAQGAALSERHRLQHH